MKKLTILLFSILISFSSYGELIEVFKDSRATDYVDTNTIELKEGKIYFWTVSNFAKPIWSSKMLSSKSQVVVDCPNGNLKILNLSMHKQPIGEGLGEKIFMKPKWQNPKVLGNPFAEAYLDFVCNFVDSKTAYYPTGEVKKVEESPEGVDTRAGLGYYTCGNGIEAQWKYAKFFLPKEAQPYTGKLCMYWENGRKKIESNIVDGLYFGKRTKWYQNGKKYSEEFFTKNATRSKAILYHKTGEVKSIKNY